MKYSIGDVYSLKESVYTAIYDIFRSTFGEGSEAFNRSCDSLQDLTRSPDVIKEGRPAIIMKDDINGDNPLGLLVCLATTYSGEDISNLPSVFQHFSIPIAPNMWHGHGDHVHGLPEWEKPNAFVIGWQFRSKATREGVWMTQADGEEVPQVLGKEAMRFLVAECKRRRETWLEMCKNLVTATALEAEVNVSATTDVKLWVSLTRVVQDHVNKRFYVSPFQLFNVHARAHNPGAPERRWKQSCILRVRHHHGSRRSVVAQADNHPRGD